MYRFVGVISVFRSIRVGRSRSTISVGEEEVGYRCFGFLFKGFVRVIVREEGK